MYKSLIEQGFQSQLFFLKFSKTFESLIELDRNHVVLGFNFLLLHFVTATLQLCLVGWQLLKLNRIGLGLAGGTGWNTCLLWNALNR